ncbi:Inner membrane symporter YicJ [Marinomonas spartinae]|uniref:Inner membrane symporter YicJ n=1 Tax=Marinomonas spartinae TaxID=1792290 RepID=A0A1A8TIU3_9GAMM|nr:MFS transporter [Marinomonas spartinae]SBS33312.1 Inner membrane symporter YicJ [Marinomonas spartinae]SBS34686.1 Inner membrane symporter YicJ [Marinomonas spartinae]
MTLSVAQPKDTILPTYSHKLSVIEKVGYSLGDLAANLIFQTLLTFLAFFYTDVYGISAGKATAIIAFGGLFGAFFTPVMGIIADRTQTRWGKFRPWILWTSIPFGAVALLAFSTPNFGDNGKVIYAFVTYIALLMIYAANNLPYSALSGVLTSSMTERNSLSSYRFVAVMVAQFVIQVLLLPLVLILGDGDKATGFHNTMLLFSIVGTIFFLITFATTKERILPVSTKRNAILVDVTDLFKNMPWVIMLLVTILIFITLALKGGMYIYYFENYLNEAQLALFLQNIGFNDLITNLNHVLNSLGLSSFKWPKDAPTSAFSVFNGVGIIMMIVGIGFSKKLADTFGKRNVFGSALFLSTLFVLVFKFLSANSIGLVFLSQILHGFFYGITIPLLWAMIADVADYSEWKNNRRATAIIFSAMILGLKVGLTIGGSLVAGLLAHYGYDASLHVQNADTIEGIKTAVSLFASLPFFLAVGCLAFYGINKQVENQIEEDLNARRRSAQ